MWKSVEGGQGLCREQGKFVCGGKLCARAWVVEEQDNVHYNAENKTLLKIHALTATTFAPHHASQVDSKSEAVLLPIYGVVVPFHITTIKNVTSNQVRCTGCLCVVFCRACLMSSLSGASCGECH